MFYWIRWFCRSTNFSAGKLIVPSDKILLKFYKKLLKQCPKDILLALFANISLVTEILFIFHLVNPLVSRPSNSLRTNSLSLALFFIFRYFGHNFVDLHRVQGISGIYIATQLVGKIVGKRHLQSVITFDKGGYWSIIRAPSTNKNCSIWVMMIFLSKSYSCLFSFQIQS